MNRLYHIAERIFAVFGVAVFCVIIWFVIATMWRVPVHQFNLWTLQKHFRIVEHPSDSRFLKKLKGFGNLFRAASNGCDYLVGELRVGSGPQEDIARFYQGLFVKSFDDTETVPIEIKFFDDEEFSEDYLWSTLWFDWREKINSSFDLEAIQGTSYVVFARQTDYPPYGDGRCFYEPPIH